MDDVTPICGKCEVTVGLDLGDKHTQLCMIDASGEVIEEARLRTTPAAMRRRFADMPAVRLVLEAGTHSPWVSRLLEDCGHEVYVANPRKLRLVYENDSKSDRVDAQYLARIGRLDPALLAPLRHRHAATQVDLALIRSRDALVRARVRLINHVRGAVKSLGGRLVKCSSESFARQARARIPAELDPALAPLLAMIEAMDEKIRTYDRQIEELAQKRYPETALLRQVPGVGALTALTYVLTLESPERFRDPRAVGSYLGLRPRRGDSGNLSPQLHITKAGDEMLRRLLVGAAQYGLPEMRGTRSPQKVVMSRRKGRLQRERSCYYGEPERVTLYADEGVTSKSLKAGGSGSSRAARIRRCPGVMSERLATRPSAVSRVTRCMRSSSSRTHRQLSPVAFSTTRMRSSASQQTGLPQMIGTRSAKKVPASR